MKKLLIIVMSIAFINGSVFAEGTFEEKSKELRKKICKVFVNAPKLSMKQRGLMAASARWHRPKIREDIKKIRTVVIEMRSTFRQQLTRDQLLKILEVQDEFILKSPCEVVATAFKKLNPAQREQLLVIIRKLWRGNEGNVEQNFAELQQFGRDVIQPYIVKELNLSTAQQAELTRIILDGQAKMRELAPPVIVKIYNLRNAVRKHLTSEQHQYIAAHRDQIFQDVLEFIKGL